MNVFIISVSCKINGNRNWVFATNPNFLIPIIITSNIIHSLKYLRSTTLGCKYIGIRKSEFVAKTQFLFNIKNTSCKQITRMSRKRRDIIDSRTSLWGYMWIKRVNIAIQRIFKSSRQLLYNLILEKLLQRPHQKKNTIYILSFFRNLILN